MDADGMTFSNEIGQELYQLLEARARERLGGAQPFDRFSAMLGAALIATAEVLRDPAERAVDLEPLMAMCTKWLHVFLDPVVGTRR
jgi:hypothetical protein